MRKNRIVEEGGGGGKKDNQKENKVGRARESTKNERNRKKERKRETGEGGIIQSVILFVAAVQSMHKVFINVACGNTRLSLSLPLPPFFSLALSKTRPRLSPHANARVLFLSRSQHAADNG